MTLHAKTGFGSAAQASIIYFPWLTLQHKYFQNLFLLTNSVTTYSLHFPRARTCARARLPGSLSAAAGLADGFDLVQVGGLDAAAVPLPGVPVAAAAAGVGGDL